MKTKTRFLTPVVFACLSLSSTAHAATVSWTGTTGGEWDTGANWSTLSKPGTADMANFNTALASVENAVDDQTVRQISFDTNAGTANGTFTLGTTGGTNLTLNSAFTTQLGIQILSTLTGTGKTISVNAPISLASATYIFANNSADSTNTLNFGGAISANSAGAKTLTLAGANKGTNTISGAISNDWATTFGVTKSGTGTWILSGANTYNGDTAISGGTLQVNAGAGGSLNSASTLKFNSSNGTFILDNTGAVGAINQSITMGSNMTGGDEVIQINRVAAQDLTLTLSAAGNPINQTTLNYVMSGTPGVNGTDSKIAITAGSAGALGGNKYFNGSNFAYRDAAGYVRGINYGTDGSSATSAGTTSIASPATWQQVTGAVTAQNTASFSNLLLSGANDFTLAESQTATVTNLLKSGGGASIISGGSGIALGSGGNNYWRVDSASDSLTISNAIAGSGRFVKSGKGTLILSGSNTSYSGEFIANDGVVNIQNANALGTTALGTSVGGALQIQGGITVTGETLGIGGMGMNNDGALRNISGDNTWTGLINASSTRINSDSGTLTITGDIALGGAGATFGGAGNISVSGIIKQNGPAVLKDGSGTLTLSGTNTWVSGFTIQEGVVSIATINNQSTNGPLGQASPSMGGTSTVGTLSYTGATASSTMKFTMNAGGGGNFEVTNAATVLTLSGQIGGSGGLTKSGPGTLSLTSSNFWGGSTTINGGTLQIAASNRIGNSPQLTLNGGTLYTVGAGSTLTLGSGSGVALGSGGGTFRTDSLTPLTIQGVVSGSGSLTKTDTGTLTLSGTNTYSGDTIVSEGVLAVSGNSIADANKLVIAGGQVKLTGTETVGTLFFGGVQQAVGSYTSADPSTNFTGGGTLIVSNGPSGNTNPTITDIANQSVPSGGNTGALAFTVGDAETAVGSLSVSGSSSNTGLVPNGNIVFDGSGASRTVTVTPVSGLSGSATITITVTDGGALTAQDTFTLTVTDNYLSWATLNGVTGGPNGDSDNDGVKNLVEYALVNGGERGVLSGNTITYSKRGAPYGTDLTYIIETSETLVDAWTDAVTHGPGLLVSNPTISYTFTPSAPVKNFARLKVNQN